MNYVKLSTEGILYLYIFYIVF